MHSARGHIDDRDLVGLRMRDIRQHSIRTDIDVLRGRYDGNGCNDGPCYNVDDRHHLCTLASNIDLGPVRRDIESGWTCRSWYERDVSIRCAVNDGYVIAACVCHVNVSG